MSLEHDSNDDPQARCAASESRTGGGGGVCVESSQCIKNMDDLNKILEDTTYRLSDLFNELSPSFLHSTLPSNSSAASSFARKHSANNQPQPPGPKKTNNLFASFGSASNSSSLLQPAETAKSFNKFPINTANGEISGAYASTSASKFYANFYRSPNLNSKNCKSNLPSQKREPLY